MEEAISLAPRGSNPLKRIVIGLIDLLAVGAGYLVISIPGLLILFQAIVIEGPYSIASTYLIAAITGAACVLYDIFFRVFLPMKFGGRTLGSAFFGAKIVSNNGEQPELLPLLIRAVCLVFLVLFSFGFYYVAEILCLVLSKEHLDITDMLSGTYVTDIAIKEEAS